MSTLIPFCNMGVTTMKMISNTSITSTIGVTLMSELTFAPSFLFANAIAAISSTSTRLRGPLQVGKAGRRFAPAPAQQLTAEIRSPVFLAANVAPLLQEVVDQFAG